MMRSLATAATLALIAGTACAQGVHEPYTDENCGVTTTYEAAPERAVTLSSNATELMLALGLEDHMAGTSYMAGMQISPDYEAAYNEIPILSPLVATTEQLIDAEADFVYAGYPDGFSESRHTRDQLHDLDMKTRLNTEGCNLGRFGFDELYEEIRSVAGIFGVPERGEALIEEMQAEVTGVEAALEGVESIPVFIYNGGEDAPRAVLGNTMLSHVVERAGGENILGDENNRYGSTSWEQLVAEAPEFIVVFYSGTESGQVVDDPSNNIGQARVDVLMSQPIIAGVPAVENENFITISSVIGQPGPSSVTALQELARAFHPEAFE
ncbi:ABC transporter substrate-binding protein [Pseudoroseicyclus tamaricis]|uniref:ABC transporter substrate-binding protein n=1 Tax=Pseudoroseicyclus tamaricis TaxID=2705421 RepID=A0A6B2JIB6_9RHOB|nr:ABC transporter substrate-binding protein [Pseudoroseicyclus tamaricis]NDV01103.1 ABC transporter substrate-binding protein [Pseudoroseicyclus tamaricis]